MAIKVQAIDIAKSMYAVKLTNGKVGYVLAFSITEAQIKLNKKYGGYKEIYKTHRTYVENTIYDNRIEI